MSLLTSHRLKIGGFYAQYINPKDRKFSDFLYGENK